MQINLQVCIVTTQFSLFHGVYRAPTVVMYVGNYPDYWVPLEFRVGSLWIPSQKVGSLY